MIFRCNSLCFTRLLVVFTEKTNIQKFLMGTSTGRPWDLFVKHPEDQVMGTFLGRPRDVGHSILTDYLRFYSKL